MSEGGARKAIRGAAAAAALLLAACGGRPVLSPATGDFAFLTIKVRGEAPEESVLALESFLESLYGATARVDLAGGAARARVRHPMTLEVYHLAREVEAAGFGVEGIEIRVAATIEGRTVTFHPTGQKLPLVGREPVNPGPGWGTFIVRRWEDPARTALELPPLDEGWLPAGPSRR
jgi:hypothetical protein